MSLGLKLDFLLPIGAACQTRYQIERFLYQFHNVKQPSCFFDWLGLGGIPGVRKIIEMDFLLKKNDFSVKSLYRDEHFTPIHEPSGFRFQHDFNSNEKNRKTEGLAYDNLNKNILKTLEKYRYLGKRTDDILRSNLNVGLIYHGKIKKEEVEELFNTLYRKYGKHYYLINVMNKGDEKPIDLDRVISIVVDNSEVKELSNAWQGSNESWDNALLNLNLLNITEYKKKVEYKEVVGRFPDKWKSKHWTYSSLADFKLAENVKPGLHTIILNSLPLDLYINLKKGLPLVILFNNSIERSSKVQLPVFPGLGLIPTQYFSTVCISDPALYLSEDLNVGWHAGTKNVPLQPLIPEIISKLIALSGTDKVVFVGGCSGGFSSLYYSRLVPESLAVIWNPQTNIMKYKASDVKKYAYEAFLIESDRADLERVINVDLLPIYREVDQNYVIYLQNKSDWHVKEHCLPFLAGMVNTSSLILETGYVRDDLFLNFYNWGKGHVPPSWKWFKSFFYNLHMYKGSWEELFKGKEVSKLFPVNN